MKIACHCLPCRKTSGTSASINLVVKRAALSVTAGSPKNFQRKGDSGKLVTYFFCPQCPTLLFVHPEMIPDEAIVKIGTLEDTDAYQNAKIDEEWFTKHRPGWCTGWFAGAKQEEAQP